MHTTDFLTYDDAVAIVSELRSERYPGLQPLRDCNDDLIRSALAQPSVTWDGRFLHASLVRQAVVLLYHVVKAHACADGNKRIAAALMDAFVKLNGWTLNTTQDDLVDIVGRVAASHGSDRDSILETLDRWLADAIELRRWTL